MSNLKILIVDDEKDFLEIIEERIKSWGHDTEIASSGKEALAAIKADNFDLVILDYMMPGEDGKEVLRKIRKENKTMPVIMFTAYPEIQVQENSKEYGANAFIPKISVYQDAQGSLKSAINIIQKQLKRE